jgi:hypothetical protein
MCLEFQLHLREHLKDSIIMLASTQKTYLHNDDAIIIIWETNHVNIIHQVQYQVIWSKT